MSTESHIRHITNHSTAAGNGAQHMRSELAAAHAALQEHDRSAHELRRDLAAAQHRHARAADDCRKLSEAAAELRLDLDSAHLGCSQAEHAATTARALVQEKGFGLQASALQLQIARDSARSLQSARDGHRAAQAALQAELDGARASASDRDRVLAAVREEAERCDPSRAVRSVCLPAGLQHGTDARWPIMCATELCRAHQRERHVRLLLDEQTTVSGASMPGEGHRKGGDNIDGRTAVEALKPVAAARCQALLSAALRDVEERDAALTRAREQLEAERASHRVAQAHMRDIAEQERCAGTA